ncbi:Protein of unknown function [Williamsia sterculiae]|uniref:LppM domain-containing protein n=1 Tax=Williamsia sterculiae TaxID=1344003 RepID=A0A1N7H773_9NOCA|nr:Protein of unknown function [Williamsia sterculiae]
MPPIAAVTWHDDPVPHSSTARATTTGRRTARIGLVATVLLLLCSPLLSGCLQSSSYVGDRLWGDFVLAEKNPLTGKGPQVDVPQSMAGNVSASEYKQGEMVGTRVTYNEISMGQFNQLGDLIGEAYPDSTVTMDLTAKRSGDVVRFRGSGDLSALTAGKDYVEFTVRFSGPVSASNGKQTTDDSATWTPDPSQQVQMTAEADYPDPSTAAFGDWTWLLAGITLLVVLAVIGLAYVFRDRSPRPGTPTAEKDSRPRAERT